MKKMGQIAVFGLMVLSALSFGTSPAYCQESFAGNWEGMFMDDFRTLIIAGVRYLTELFR